MTYQGNRDMKQHEKHYEKIPQDAQETLEELNTLKN